nr:nucleotidyltransferase domain-containing protein [Maliibacterium massiliense]
MMVENIEAWMQALVEKLRQAFGGNLRFVGLQGSYNRGEAKAGSDIDVVVVFDALDTRTLARYRTLACQMPCAQDLCGFVCDAATLARWPRHDLLQLARDTRAFYGTLETLAPSFTRADARMAVRVDAANLYHAACHSYLFAQDRGEALRGLAKSAFFVLRTYYYVRSGEWIVRKDALVEALAQEGMTQEAHVILTGEGAEAANLDARYDALIGWCASLLAQCAAQ